MFDSNFLNSVAKVNKCSQISDSMPFWYVSQMYDSKMSSKASMMKDSMIWEEKIVEPKWLEEFTLLDLVDRFL